MQKHLDKRGPDGKGHKDWIHAVSKTRMYKAQHPGWEFWQLGPHGQQNVSCADCHMPYESRGGMKYSSHHVTSPLEYIDKTCQVCHRQPAEELERAVKDRQHAIVKLRTKAENVLVKAHFETKAAMEEGATDTELENIRTLIREAQWRWDFAVASHGASFHAPLQVSNILGDSIDKAAQARLELSKVLAKHGFIGDVTLPDISTKAKAQKVIGLNMDKLNKEKADFLKNMVPKWDEEAEKRHKSWDEKKGI
jgi:nitrite reductase (cytochrome c-552)